MRGKNTGFRRVLAILLCVLLVTGSPGSTAFAGNFTPASDEPLLRTGEETVTDEENAADEVFSSDSEELAGETQPSPDENGITLIQTEGGVVNYELTFAGIDLNTYVTLYNVNLCNTPDEGYKFDRYVVTDPGGNAISLSIIYDAITGEASYSFSKQPATISAVFVKQSHLYDIVVSQPAGGTVSVSKAQAEEGERVYLSYTEQNGYLFRRFVVTKTGGETVEVSDSSLYSGAQNWVFTMPAESVTVTAEFTIAHAITVRQPEHGNIRVVSSAAPGDEISLGLSYWDTGYNVRSYAVKTQSGTDVQVNYDNLFGAWSFIMPDSPVTVSAEMERIQCSLIWQPTHCTVSGPDSGYYGETITFTVTPEEGYRVSTIDVGESISSSMPIVLTNASDNTRTYEMTLGGITGEDLHVKVVCSNADEAGFAIKTECHYDNRWSDDADSFSLAEYNNQMGDFAVITNAAGQEITRAEGGEEITIRLRPLKYNLYIMDECYFYPSVFFPRDYFRLTGNDTFIMPFHDMNVHIEIVHGHAGQYIVDERPPEYNLSVADGIEHGTVTAEDNKITVGYTAKVYVTADEGYMPYSLSYSYTPVGGTGPQTVEIPREFIDNKNFMGKFVMPGADVIVTATFVKRTPIPYIASYQSGGIAVHDTLPSLKVPDYDDLSPLHSTLYNWMAVTGEVVIDHRLDVAGSATLILCDGARLNLPYGIHVEPGDTLTIYAQSDDDDSMGELNINHVEDDFAGIGGNSGEAGGTVIINGGRITVYGGKNGAGIGGGANGDGGNITINGGTVTAVGGNNGAGIGGGANGDGDRFTVNGDGLPMVTAAGGSNGAGIGGGANGAGGSIAFNGGIVTAGSSGDGAGIGAGHGYVGSAPGSLNVVLSGIFDSLKASSYATKMSVAENCPLQYMDDENRVQVLFPGTVGNTDALADRSLKKAENVHTVTVNNGPGGSVTAPPMAQANTEVTLLIEPETGYMLNALTVKDVLGNNIAVSNNSFQMPANSVTITAKFSKLYKVTVADSENGLVALSGNQTSFFEGQNVLLTVTPDTGYEVSSLTYTLGDADHVTIENNQFAMPEGDVTVRAVFSPDPNHFEQTGENEYTIKTAAGWDVFCDLLEQADGKNYFSGKTVRLGTSIGSKEEPITRMAGGSGHDFTGTFDGGGYTLTVRYGTFESPIETAKAAPFVNVENGCTIENLHVAGDLYTRAQYGAGLVSTQYGKVSIRNCRVSTVIHSFVSGNGTHGGIVARNGNGTGSELTITGCLFDGRLLSEGGTDTAGCAGFVGEKNKTVTITDSIYAPGEPEEGEREASASGAAFVRNGSAGKNCYYTRTFGTAQGKKALAITAGEDVALVLCGEVSEDVPDGFTEYETSGITAYNNNRGLKYGDVFYAGEGEDVRLSLSYTGTPAAGYRFNGYAVNAGTFADAGAASGTEDPCTLTMPGLEVTVTAELAFADGLGAVAGQSISLDGDIGINFYMELSEEVSANESAYMLFTIPAGGKTETKKVYVKDVTKKNGCYVFKCGVAAKEMDSQIKAQLICGDKYGTEYTYSVREYAEYLLNNAKEDGTAVQQAFFRAVPLVEAMLQYGRYAKEYFDKTNELGDPGHVVITRPETAFDLPDGVTFDGATLSLKSETTLSLYFKCENNETLTFSCGGKTVETVSSGGYQIARIRGIAAAELQSSFTVTINDNYSATYSPMNYCFNVLNMDIDDPENPAAEVTRLQNVVKALCLYSQSARTYFGQEG